MPTLRFTFSHIEAVERPETFEIKVDQLQFKKLESRLSELITKIQELGGTVVFDFKDNCINIKNCPNFIRFRLCTLNPTVPDAVTQLPLDEGFGAIVQSCKGLKRLSVSGLLTDQVFLYIGMYAEQLEMLSIAFAGESDKGMLYVLNGCKKLKKLEIRDSPFGDVALLADMGKYETMRSLWMSSCEVTLEACKKLAMKMPRLNVEIINENEQMEASTDDKQKVEKMYLYRTLVGPRKDAPAFVWTL
mgnify:CR=1 FL=1